MNVFKRFSKQINARYFSFEMITATKLPNKVGLVKLNRPKAKNALCRQLFMELNEVVASYDNDPAIKSIVLTGDPKYFAAGADIKEMKDLTYVDVHKNDFLYDWTFISSVRKPIIGAVCGWALGGGFELALMCDIIIAGNNAKLGLPEITIGTIPGAGGTQRVSRIIGKSRAMEMILTGEPMMAEEALSRGLVSRLVEPEKCEEEAILLAEKINAHSGIMATSAKRCVNASFETTLQQGLEFERQVFWATFATVID